MAAVIVALLAGALALGMRLGRPSRAIDFDQLWLASRALWQGHDPYLFVPTAFAWPLYYPLPAVLITLPFAALPRLLASSMWVAIGFGILTYVLTSRGWWTLVTLLSVPAIDAIATAQWTPVLTASALAPSLAWLAAGKPSTGGSIVGAYMSRRAIPSIAAAIALVILSFAVNSHWLIEWGTAVRSASHFRPLISRPGGAVLLVAALKWRRPEARLLLLYAVVPQTTAPYDALPLALCVNSRREALTLAWLGFAGMPFYQSRVGTGIGFLAAQDHNAPILLLTLYLPCLLMVLRRPNTTEGSTGVCMLRANEP